MSGEWGKVLGKTMMAICRRLAGASPEARQVIIGAGLAFDPLPEARYATFERSDARALAQDWAAVSDNLWWAIGRARKEHERELGS